MLYDSRVFDNLLQDILEKLVTINEHILHWLALLEVLCNLSCGCMRVNSCRIGEILSGIWLLAGLGADCLSDKAHKEVVDILIMLGHQLESLLRDLCEAPQRLGVD